MHGCYGSTCTSSCCLSSLFFSAAARWGRFFPPLQDDGNLSTLLKEVKRLNISGVVRVTEYVCMRTRPHLHYLTTGQTTRTMIAGCVLQECCIVLTGKPLLCLWVWSPEICHKITACFKMSGSFNWAYCVWGNLWCSGKGKESSKVFKKTTTTTLCMTIIQNILIWSQSSTHRHSSLC